MKKIQKLTLLLLCIMSSTQAWGWFYWYNGEYLYFHKRGDWGGIPKLVINYSNGQRDTLDMVQNDANHDIYEYTPQENCVQCNNWHIVEIAQLDGSVVDKTEPVTTHETQMVAALDSVIQQIGFNSYLWHCTVDHAAILMYSWNCNEELHRCPMTPHLGSDRKIAYYTCNKYLAQETTYSDYGSSLGSRCNAGVKVQYGATLYTAGELHDDCHVMNQYDCTNWDLANYDDDDRNVGITTTGAKNYEFRVHVVSDNGPDAPVEYPYVHPVLSITNYPKFKVYLDQHMSLYPSETTYADDLNRLDNLGNLWKEMNVEVLNNVEDNSHFSIGPIGQHTVRFYCDSNFTVKTKYPLTIAAGSTLTLENCHFAAKSDFDGQGVVVINGEFYSKSSTIDAGTSSAYAVYSNSDTVSIYVNSELTGGAGALRLPEGRAVKDAIVTDESHWHTYLLPTHPSGYDGDPYTGDMTSNTIDESVRVGKMDDYRLVVGPSGWATVSLPWKSIFPNNASVYLVTWDDDTEKLVLQQYPSSQLLLPEQKGYLVHAAPGAYLFTRSSYISYENGGILKAHIWGGMTDGAETGESCYKLAQGSKGLGWYYGAADGGEFALDAYKAYLTLSDEQAVQSRLSLEDMLADAVATALAGETGETGKAVKILLDGQILIVRGGKMYDVNGQMVK